MEHTPSAPAPHDTSVFVFWCFNGGALAEPSHYSITNNKFIYVISKGPIGTIVLFEGFNKFNSICMHFLRLVNWDKDQSQVLQLRRIQLLNGRLNLGLRSSKYLPIIILH